MKRIISALLVLAMAGSMLVACGGNENGETTTTTAATTTTKRQDNPPPTQGSTLPDDTELLKEGEDVWKYHVVEVIWDESSGVKDYITRTTDGFGDFVTQHPDWMTPEFDDSEWSSKEAPFGDRISEANATAIGWTNDNHGLFLRTTFEITQEDIDKIKEDKAAIYAWTWYDNTCYMYLNGTEIFAHDDSELFQEGTAGDDGALGVHDWLDNYAPIYFNEDEVYYTYDGNVADLLVAGENTFAISLLDCWGGREFDLGLSVEYYE